MSAALRNAAQQALEALKSCSGVPHWPALQPTITALRKALAQEEQEPAIYPDEAREMGLEEVALYTYPPCREWHSLTDKEIRRMGIETPGQQGGWNLVFARAVEAALKEKNA